MQLAIKLILIDMFVMHGMGLFVYGALHEYAICIFGSNISSKLLLEAKQFLIGGGAGDEFAVAG